SFHLSDIGINAKVIKRFEADHVRGFRGYLKQYFKELWHKEFLKYKIETEGKNYKGKAYMIVIANAKRYGTGAVINPNGNPGDGMFELCIIKDISFRGILIAFWSIFDNDALARATNLKVIPCKQAVIQLSKKQIFQVDGELIGDTKKLEIEIMPGVIQMIC
ncbi:MAG: diacylglycerol/lipid kinase family protein, partial [Cyclobacteriaceae bacterium]